MLRSRTHVPWLLADEMSRSALSNLQQAGEQRDRSEQEIKGSCSDMRSITPLSATRVCKMVDRPLPTITGDGRSPVVSVIVEIVESGLPLLGAHGHGR